MSATNNAVQAQYAGPATTSLATLLEAAFSTSCNTNAVNQNDIIQIVDPLGKVVFNLSYTGTATDNPTTPTATAIAGQFQSHAAANSTRAQYFAAAFTNPQNLDILQVLQPGGSVAFWLDYQGVTHTSGVS